MDQSALFDPFGAEARPGPEALRPRPGRWRSAIVLFAAVVAVAGGCSGAGDDAQPPFSAPTTRDPGQPQSMGETCTDPVGDLSSDARNTTPGTLTEPSGIDLVEASTRVEGDSLTVDITTRGAIVNALNPEFFVDSGDPQQAPANSWELRLSPSSGSGKATLVTFPTALGARDQRTPVDAAVSVRDNRLSASLPLRSLPPISSSLWMFGSSAGASDVTRIFDECLPFLSSPGTTTPGGSVPSSSTVASPTTMVSGSVGQPVTAPDGSAVTVRTVDVPARPNRVPEQEPLPGTRLAAVEAEVCAGSVTVEGVGERRFTLRTSDGTGSAPWAAPAYTNDPRFPASQTLRPGECAVGWISFQIGPQAQATQVLYDAGGTGAGPFVAISVP